MKTFALLFLLLSMNQISSQAETFPVASPRQDASKLMRQRKDLLGELTQAGIAALKLKPISCSSTTAIFAALRKSEPLPSCAKAKDQFERMLKLEKNLLSNCQGPKALEVLGKFSSDDEWYGKMLDLQAEGKDSGELAKLECEIPLTLGYQARKRLDRIANAK